MRIAVALIAGLALAACAEESPPEPVVAPTPERILAVAPSITEILFALGLGDKVVAVGDYAQWPPEVFSKPRIGGLFDLHLEKIVELDPDLVIVLPGEERLAAQMRELGVDVLVVQHESLADVETSMRTIAGRMDVVAAGEELAAAFRRDLEPQPFPSAPTVLLTITRDAGNVGDLVQARFDVGWESLVFVELVAGGQAIAEEDHQGCVFGRLGCLFGGSGLGCRGGGRWGSGVGSGIAGGEQRGETKGEA